MSGQPLNSAELMMPVAITMAVSFAHIEDARTVDAMSMRTIFTLV